MTLHNDSVRHKHHVDFDYNWTGENAHEAFLLQSELGRGYPPTSLNQYSLVPMEKSTKEFIKKLALVLPLRKFPYKIPLRKTWKNLKKKSIF